ncbi:uncharacterized protein BT62DRAFT_936643 [Guyanagaster necrorhizus]|uniref:MYND-type domain-containing protein n=1 Tax=Guyanagaster necrorhizus TaxID=856835 RepID=A0A9P7VJX2_9AGAR|nr:uncharacterized protein BT62DRAFT_936643 [Guyanagaster necrorhizus MCA 3950]KAG7441992.1 hypothetical protein BT62DRAFT_936643 [Guyanagaster necrorhizus MCA 3950]
MNPTCLVCDTPTNKRCARCKGAYYCSKAHIAQDWPAHKTYCKRVSDAGTDTFDAILFGVNETKPRLIKLPWSYGPLEREFSGGWHKLDMEPWFKGKDSFVRTHYVQTFGTNGPVLRHTLAVRFDDNFMINGSQINRCIQNVTSGNAAHPWAGNILALRVEGLGSPWYSDVVMEEDLAPLARYFEDCYRK